MTLVEVRCCCRPEKLLGHLPVREEWLRDGASVHFVLPARFHGHSWDHTARVEPGAVVRLPVATYVEYPYDEYGEATTRLALKSEETPIETLRQIPGFIEARLDDDRSTCHRR